ncbi:lantibiotic dehydratase [Streptomyces sp. NRRL S-495]|uniref:lantibiotic dehydratase n=1 Tax=Streptomyces sp. NRRL S-495 TaxID=1609133 RepID=UPI000697B967|nr:lantibiotic dehydratase [Streptomyces sp. NRRL S-495]
MAERPARPGRAAHHIPLDTGAFALWDQFVVRTAGMPAEWVDRLATDPAPPTADERPDAYAARFEQAARSSAEALLEVAREPLFREAVAWQNPKLVVTHLDGFAARPLPERRNNRVREKETVLTRYVQRYCTKNDTIGFFGPVAWGTVDDGDGMRVDTGAGLLSARSVYFEVWAVDAVADALLERHGLRPWVAPRRNPSVELRGGVAVAPYRAPITLDELSAVLLAAANGTRSARELAEEASWLGLLDPADEQAVPERLAALERRGLLRWDLTVPLGSRPEQDLRARLLACAQDGPVRAALAELDRLIAARDRVAAAAGDPDAVVAAVAALHREFEEVTGAGAYRRDGEFGAGRTVVYEDTVRDVELRLGRSAVAAFGPALALVLESARWLTHEVAREYLRIADELYDGLVARDPDGPVRLSSLTLLLGPHLVGAEAVVPAQVSSRLRERWWALLADAVERADGPVTLDSAELRAAVRETFDCPRAGWTAARYHSPDLMVSAADPADVASGDALFVLGELHAAVNTTENRVFCAQHPDPAQLLERVERDGIGHRVVPMLPKEWRAVTSRTFPPLALLSPTYTYWSIGNDPGGAPTTAVLPAAGLTITREDGVLWVGDAGGGFRAELLEVLGELLSMVTVNAFGMVPDLPHVPRITIDGLVVVRETWRVPADGLGLGASPDEAADHRAFGLLAERLGLPRRTFVRVTGERKPVYVDARNPLLVRSLLRMVRKAAKEGPAELVISEMLPDPDGLWLSRPGIGRYTTEFRFVAVDHHGLEPGGGEDRDGSGHVGEGHVGEDHVGEDRDGVDRRGSE